MHKIVVLIVANRWNCYFERRAHEPIAADTGASEAELAAICENGSLHSMNTTEQVMLATVWTILNTADFTDEEYEVAADQVGPGLVFELLTLIGY